MNNYSIAEHQKNVVEIAQSYAARGWQVLPLHSPAGADRCSCRKPDCPSPGKHPVTHRGSKDSTICSEQIASWWTDYPYANLGVATGEASGLLVLDIDPGHGGNHGLRALEAEFGALPLTLTVETGGGGQHYYFKHPGGEAKNRTNLAGNQGLDVRGDGGYVVAPPSLHRSGQTYRFVEPAVALADPPAWLVELVRAPAPRSRTVAALGSSVGKIGEGGRNDSLTRLAGGLLRQGVIGGDLENALNFLNEQVCDPPLLAREVETIVRSVSTYSPGRHEFPLTDTGNAERLVDTYGGEIRFCEPEKSWYVWNGVVWVKDDRQRIHRLAKQVIRAIGESAGCEPDEQRQQAHRKHAKASEASARRKAMVDLAQSENGVAVSPDDFDPDPWLLTVTNGVLDLRSGELLPHRPDLLCTKASKASYEPTAQCPTWLAFLNRIFAGNEALIGYLQRAVGYSLTGATNEQCFFLLHGAGRNGKSTFVGALRGLVGDYSQQASFATFMAREKNAGAASPDLAKLRGSRVVVASESSDGKAFDEAVIKSLTGGEEVSCRFLHANEFSYLPQFKLWLSTNHRPEIKGADEGIWRRVHLVPFNVTIGEGEVDKDLPAKLERELPGILAWAVRGCLEWQHEGGLVPPDEVREATAAYREEMDTIGAFLADYTVKEEGARVTSKVLNEAYNRWCAANAAQPISQAAFGRLLTARGFPAAVNIGRERSRGRAGLRMKTDVDRVDEALGGGRLVPAA